MKLTPGKIFALAVLSDGEAHETSAYSNKRWVSGICARSLVDDGLAEYVRNEPGLTKVRWTPNGQEAYEAHLASRRSGGST